MAGYEMTEANGVYLWKETGWRNGSFYTHIVYPGGFRIPAE